MPELHEIRPLRSRAVAQNLEDQAGGIAYGGFTEGDAESIAFGGPTADFILYGVVNGAFAQGPADPNANIENDVNPLPYWAGPTQVSGGAVTAAWVEDSGSPSGNVLRLTLHPGAASDEAYFQQIVPIGGGAALYHVGEVTAIISNSTGASEFTVEMQYLDAGGTATGSAAEGTVAMSVITDPYSLDAGGWDLVVPSDAVYLRIRIGLQRSGAPTSDTSTVDVWSVSRVDWDSYTAFPDLSNPSTYDPGRIFQNNGQLSISTDGGAGPSVGISTPSNLLILSATTSQVSGDLLVDGDATVSGALQVTGALTVGDERTVGGWTVVEKTADEDITNSAAIQDDDELQFSTSTGTSYLIEGVIEYQLQSGTAADLKIDLGTDSTARGVYTCRGFSTADAAQLSTILGNQTETATFGGTTTVRIVEIAGWHRSAGGTWKLRWAQNAATVGVYTRVRAGSYIRYQALG